MTFFPRLTIVFLLLCGTVAAYDKTESTTMVKAATGNRSLKSKSKAKSNKSTKSNKSNKSNKSAKSIKSAKSNKSNKSNKSSQKNPPTKNPTKVPTKNPTNVPTINPTKLIDRTRDFNTVIISQVTSSMTKPHQPIDNILDGNPTTFSSFTTNTAVVRLAYDVPVNNNQYKISVPRKNLPFPKSWIVEALTTSANGDEWTVIDTVTNFNFSGGKTHSFDLNTDLIYSELRVKFTEASRQPKQGVKYAISSFETIGLPRTHYPTTAPTGSPTPAPTESPTPAPTAFPTAAPTSSPTSAPTALPTAAPTSSPTPVNGTAVVRRSVLEESLVNEEIKCPLHYHEAQDEYSLIEYVTRLLPMKQKTFNIFQPATLTNLYDPDMELSIPGMTVRHHMATVDMQKEFLKVHATKCFLGGSNNDVLKKFDVFVKTKKAQFATEMWKYCALAVYGGAYIDRNIALLEPFVDTFSFGMNYAVLRSLDEDSIYGAMIVLQSPMSQIATSMMNYLVTTEMQIFEQSPDSVPKALYRFILEDLDEEGNREKINVGLNEGKNSRWMMLNERCEDVCPESGYCCDVKDECKESIIMLS